MGRCVPELNQAHIREMLLGHYRLIYSYDPNEHQVAILALLHGARMFPIDEF